METLSGVQYMRFANGQLKPPNPLKGELYTF